MLLQAEAFHSQEPGAPLGQNAREKLNTQHPRIPICNFLSLNRLSTPQHPFSEQPATSLPRAIPGNGHDPLAAAGMIAEVVAARVGKSALYFVKCRGILQPYRADSCRLAMRPRQPLQRKCSRNSMAGQFSPKRSMKLAG
jgi:hypothetical protein